MRPGGDGFGLPQRSGGLVFSYGVTVNVEICRMVICPAATTTVMTAFGPVSAVPYENTRWMLPVQYCAEPADTSHWALSRPRFRRRPPV